MCKAFYKKLLASALSLCMVVSAMGALPAMAADEQSDKGYVITFRPGEYGQFTEQFKNNLIQTYGQENCKVSNATGAVAVLVPVGSQMPSAPTLNDIQLSAEDATRYFVTDAASGYVGGTANQDVDTVAVYDLRQSGAEMQFTVQYLDRETGAEVAPALQGTANVGQNIVFRAASVANYTAQTGEITLQVGESAEQNVVTFYYTAGVNTVTETEVVGGGTVIEYQDQVVAGGAAVVPAPGGGAGGAGGGGGTAVAGDDTVTVPDADTPLVQNPEDTQAGDEDTVDIEENEAPLAQNLDEQSNKNMAIVIAGGAAILLVIAVGLILVRRHNKAVDEG